VASVSRIDRIIGLFAKEPCKRDDILQKRPKIESIILTVATPYTHTSHAHHTPYTHTSHAHHTPYTHTSHPIHTHITTHTHTHPTHIPRTSHVCRMTYNPRLYYTLIFLPLPSLFFPLCMGWLRCVGSMKLCRK